jgi:hypothetical protein
MKRERREIRDEQGEKERGSKVEEGGRRIGGAAGEKGVRY